MSRFVRGRLPAVARTTMAHPDHDLKITLYPMFHVGSPAFYGALSEDLSRFRVFLLEGVRYRGWRRPLYDLIARNMGVVTQSDRLILPDGSERVPLDMTAEEFARDARELPIGWRLALRFLRPLLWLLTATAAGRDARWTSWGRRRSRSEDDDERPLMELILTKRDRVMSESLRRLACDPHPPSSFRDE